jgi:hypothetical protein
MAPSSRVGARYSQRGGCPIPNLGAWLLHVPRQLPLLEPQVHQRRYRPRRPEGAATERMAVKEHAADMVTRQALDAGAAVGKGRATPRAGLGGFFDGIDIKGGWLIEEHAHCTSSGRLTGASHFLQRQGPSSPPGSL